ncbi:preprotein translocase subunit SecB [Marinobacter sp. ES-1]|jgi:preprotein translocase subunit SecB|uniref:Protein-export protein SecB n=1 Tax=Marinobacter vinifirmus TaxID=355591 RepID=A0A7Z1DX60_9GAMM|nr:MULTISPECIES: protein-export chaperone SecB [Marinobacter]HBM49235.1 protein-export chaperone SecB [Marinobacter sp.]ERP91962.1 preprotein translocase subunit SecB [Marinobacter sp. ES-1]KRW80770.1 preprotein translocase subunit SecB [Marinobacter sp. P4B1]MCE0758302.1 protein-export chaperone SecB [Marinobacter sp. G11]OZC37560.1 preprotein translocase subunit SecB [Marinobacter vinifirmus]|tara:strand:- start:1290 stop:1787 length:498 start_codon:yes stop_codon:yes gene_type:complete
MAENQQAAGNENQNQPQFALQRIYVKDLSFESPNSPLVFQEQWKPQVNLDLNTAHNKLSDNQYEVVLSLTVTAKVGEKVAYIVEIQQAGVFLVAGIEGAQLGQMLGAYCPNILFPYAREAIDATVNRGSFPALMLAPVNFDAIYAQALKRKQEEAAGEAKEEQTH